MIFSREQISDWRKCSICTARRFKADLKAAGEKIMSAEPSKYKYFFTGGTCIPDEFAISYFEDASNVVVVDRKGDMWRQGKPFAKNTNHVMETK